MKRNRQKLAGAAMVTTLALSLTAVQAQNTGPNVSGSAGDLSGTLGTTGISVGSPSVFGANGYTKFQSWQSTVATAYATGNGGVWNSAFNGSTGGQADSVNAGYTALWNNLVLNYGANKSLTLTLNSDSATGGNNLFQSSMYASANASSGYLAIGPNDGGPYNTTAYTFGFALSGSGLAAGEAVNSVAFDLLGRSGAVGTVTFTALFSDATSQTLSLGSALGTQGQNSFFEFDAPTGASIVSLTYSSTTGRINPLDDFSFTTAVPEPSTVASGILGGLGLLWMRRFRRHA